MLLNGGCGYDKLRSHSLLAVDGGFWPILIEVAATEGMPAGQPSRLQEVIDA
jgi:hypothetical protein